MPSISLKIEKNNHPSFYDIIESDFCCCCYLLKILFKDNFSNFDLFNSPLNNQKHTHPTSKKHPINITVLNDACF